MSEDTVGGPWFDGLDPENQDAAVAALEDGECEQPADWPAVAVDEGFASDESAYYERLHGVALETARRAVQAREGADDQQLIHTVRTMEDLERTANELAERLDEWAGSLGLAEGGGIDGARRIIERPPGDEVPDSLSDVAEQIVELDEQRDSMRRRVERHAPAVAPNLSALAGPILAARLIALAGSLQSLARMPSGTVQVLGAEEALFAHLRGEAPSPKHGVIYTHEAVRGTRPADRGSAARALAGKLSIAARVDHYSGDRRPALERELADRIATIQDREGSA